MLFFQIENDDHNINNSIKSSWYPYTISIYDDQSSIDEYAPKINIEGKPRRPQKLPKSFIRPRYYFTELGIRERLFMGVLTSQEYLHSRGVVFNKTIGHLVEKIRYFISIGEGAKKPNITLSGIVGFTDTRSVLKPFHVIKYITDNYLEDYDYYYIVKDKSYINGRKLMNFIDNISVSSDIYSGIPSKYNNNYCSLDAGILLSNSMVRKLKTNLDWCVKNTYSVSDDINFGRCVNHATKLTCSMRVNEVIFNGKQLPWNFNFNQHSTKAKEDHKKFHDELINSISVYPIVHDHSIIYRINSYFLINELKKVEDMIELLRKKIITSSYFGPNNNIKKNIVSWPVGNWHGNKSPGRFDILRWNYFNETHIFMQTDFENSRQLIGITRLDIDRVLQTAIDKINVDYKNELKFNKLINGYLKFDASRGMDYILDLSLINANNKLSYNKQILKRMHINKPLGKVDILPVPYVTENTRINIILIVHLSSINNAVKFMENYVEVCMEKRDKTSLMLVLIYNKESPSKGSDDIYGKIKTYALNFTDQYKRIQSKISWLSIRLPSISSNVIKSDPPFKIAVADLVVQKFSSESLLLFVQTDAILTTEYLNRIRMNTISQWQIYCPIPFVEFHPDLAYADELKKINIDLNRNHGRYDELNYESISFYKIDYQTMRKMNEDYIPITHGDKDIPNKMTIMSDKNVIHSIYELFIFYGKLHVFRAVEPALKIHHNVINCTDELNEYIRQKCVLSNSRQIGHRGQLAKLIKEYHES
ncbi:hypothetical protein PV325_006116 [Microctonus aethiopoides]|nr:hypothetical protein PV325_006116 [Microctonus aethiopoides]